MTLQAGERSVLRVLRELPPYGWIVGEGTKDGGEALLPYTEAVRERPVVGDRIEVFLFHDSKNRLTATRREPLLERGRLGRLAVADLHPRFGVFLELGIGRQLLLPLKELPPVKAEWPEPGDELHVVMTHDKSGRMLARLARFDELAGRAVRAPAALRGRTGDGWVAAVSRGGAIVMLEAGPLGEVLGHLPREAMTHPPRLGQRVRVRVGQVREDGRVTLTMRPPKAVGRLEDAERLLAFLRERPGGGMPYSDETPADLIRMRFGISKAAFKRALGKLMKDGLVEQRGNWTYLKGVAPQNRDE
jgi:predicted RNA-binding protein (virulence factor B family)